MGTPSETPSILDLEHLRRQTAGDRDLERELLALFVAQCARLRPLLAAAPSTAERADAAHTLKGSARAIGAWSLAGAADRLEAALRGGGPEPMGLVGEIEAIIAAACDAAAAQGRPTAAA
jgi:HPt (histidine-containing phosphotransfer) domain-containing protein